jgi:hypothetical protein
VVLNFRGRTWLDDRIKNDPGLPGLFKDDRKGGPLVVDTVCDRIARIGGMLDASDGLCCGCGEEEH